MVLMIEAVVKTPPREGGPEREGCRSVWVLLKRATRPI